MQAVIDFSLAHPLWLWLGVGAVLLALEVSTGSGYLLWPSASAAVVGVLTLFVKLGLAGEVAVFAVLTIITTLLARRFFPPSLPRTGEPDINDKGARLLGRTGEASGAFVDGKGRVLVDGSEWWAELDGDEAPAAGGRVEVTQVLGGARLRVKAV